VLHHGRPLKINYVCTSPKEQSEDIRAMITAFHGRDVTINILDDIYASDVYPADIIALVTELNGPPCKIHRKRKVGLPTLIHTYPDGLRFEFKDDTLGSLGPWRSCVHCPQRSACKEGIFCLRVDVDGSLFPCIYRGELRHVPTAAARLSPFALADNWNNYLSEVLA